MKNRLAKTGILLLLIFIPIVVYFYFNKSDKEIIVPNQSPIFTQIPDQIINEGDIFPGIKLYDYITDADNNDVEISIKLKNGTRLTTEVSSDGVLTARSPNVEWFGSDTIGVTVTDPGGLTDKININFNVLPINDRPAVTAIPGQTIKEGELFSPIKLNQYVSDIDNTPEEISWAILGQTIVNVKIDKQNTAFIKPVDENIFGKDTLLFIATDPGHLASTERVVFEIKPVNDPPALQSILLPIINEGESFPEINLTGYVEDIDNQKDELKFHVSNGKHLSVKIDSNNHIHITPPFIDWFGRDTLFYSVSDSNYSVTESIIAVILPVNDEPVIKQISSQTIKEDDRFQPIKLNNFVDDIDNIDDELCWHFSGNSIVYLTIDDNNIMNISPLDGKFGSDTITISVRDPENLTASTTTIFTVVEKTFWEGSPFKEIKSAAHTGVNDILSLAASPFCWDESDFLKFGILISLTATTTLFDKDIKKNIASDRGFANSDLLKLGEYYGNSNTSIGASIAFFGGGLISGEDELTQIGLEIFESYIIVNELTSLLKNGFGRERPKNGGEATNFHLFTGKGEPYQSLPSGHTAIAFSLSSVIAGHVNDCFLKSLIFAPAFITAAERIYNNNHWASDVILGSAVGYFIGTYLVSLHRKSDSDDLTVGINNRGEITFIYPLN
ncbi:Ig-like domain-containing protein [Bacteroidota bacterium]